MVVSGDFNFLVPGERPLSLNKPAPKDNSRPFSAPRPGQKIPQTQIEKMVDGIVKFERLGKSKKKVSVYGKSA